MMGLAATWVVLGLPMAFAADVAVRARVVGGALGIGEAGTLEVLLTRDGVPVTGELTRQDGQPVESIGTGRYRTELVRAAQPGTVPATLATATEVLSVDLWPDQPTPVPEVQWPDRIVGLAGSDEPLEIPLQWAGQGSLDDIWVATGAGSLVSIRDDGGTLIVGLRLPVAPMPRAIPLLAVDLAAPGAPPVLGSAILRARTQIPVRTTPGTTVSVQLGSRDLPSVVADDSGLATVVARVRPGEETATIHLQDAAGNTSTSTIRLGGDPRPQLVGLATPGQPGERLPSVAIAATTAGGAPWTGAAPVCATPEGRPLTLFPVDAGVWRGPVTLPELELGSVECHIGQLAHTSVRLPRTAPAPDRVVLRVQPPELDARSPEATIRAWVVDGNGDRLPGQPPQISVDHGAILSPSGSAESGVVHGRYDGTGAVGTGEDVVRATWTFPSGSGPVRDLQLQWAPADGQLWVWGRALDARGHPIPGTPLIFSLGEASEDGLSTESSWSRGSFTHPVAPQWLAVRAGQSGRSTGAWVIPGAPGAAAPTITDFETHTAIRILTGPVRRVGLQVQPPTLQTVDGASARVILELWDRDGHPVTDLPVELTASRGRLGPVLRRPDGRFEATYEADRPGDIGKVEIVALSPEDHFPATVTELELEAEAVRRAPGLHLGWLAGADGISSPWVSIDGLVPVRAFPERMLLRLSGGLYGLRASASDPSTGQELSVAADLAPIGAGLVGRRPRGRLVTHVGGSVLLVPYRVQVSVDTTTGLRGLALAPPGAHAFTGAGIRTRHGELDLELGYLLVTTRAGDGGWQGSAGGFLTTIGYRHLF